MAGDAQTRSSPSLRLRLLLRLLLFLGLLLLPKFPLSAPRTFFFSSLAIPPMARYAMAVSLTSRSLHALSSSDICIPNCPANAPLEFVFLSLSLFLSFSFFLFLSPLSLSLSPLSLSVPLFSILRHTPPAPSLPAPSLPAPSSFSCSKYRFFPLNCLPPTRTILLLSPSVGLGSAGCVKRQVWTRRVFSSLLFCCAYSSHHLTHSLLPGLGAGLASRSELPPAQDSRQSVELQTGHLSSLRADEPS